MAAANRVIHSFRVRLDSDRDSNHERIILRRQFEGALLIVSVMYPVLFLLTDSWAAIPRYLFPLYLVTPLIVTEADARFGRWFGRWRSVPAAAVLSWNLAGALVLTPQDTAPRDHGILIASHDQPILELFRRHKIRTMISNDYWVGFRIAFQSGDTIIPVMRFPDGSLGYNRFSPYVEQGLRDPRPAYLELTDAWEGKILTSRWAMGALPGYSLHVVDIYTVVVPPV